MTGVYPTRRPRAVRIPYRTPERAESQGTWFGSEGLGHRAFAPAPRRRGRRFLVPAAHRSARFIPLLRRRRAERARDALFQAGQLRDEDHLLLHHLAHVLDLPVEPTERATRIAIVLAPLLFKPC